MMMGLIENDDEMQLRRMRKLKRKKHFDKEAKKNPTNDPRERANSRPELSPPAAKPPILYAQTRAPIWHHEIPFVKMT